MWHTILLHGPFINTYLCKIKGLTMWVLKTIIFLTKWNAYAPILMIEMCVFFNFPNCKAASNYRSTSSKSWIIIMKSIMLNLNRRTYTKYKRWRLLQKRFSYIHDQETATRPLFQRNKNLLILFRMFIS